MKRVLVLLLLICLTVVLGVSATALAKPGVTSIQDGTLLYAAGHYLEGEPLVVGLDPYGYNYQGHVFQGSYANSYLGKDGFPPYMGDTDSYLAENPAAANTWYWPYRDSHLIMEWNNAWLANTDADGDGALDRHLGLPSYIGSGAWLTNHGDGYVAKIAAAPVGATTTDGMWYASDGTEIGPVIWGQFAIMQEVWGGGDGVIYVSPFGPDRGTLPQ